MKHGQTRSRSLLAGGVLTALLALPLGLSAGTNLLDLVPPDCTAVGMVNLSELRASPLAPRLITETDRLAVQGEASRFLERAGLKPMEDVDRIVFASTGGPETADMDHRALVLLEGRFDVKKLEGAIVAEGGTIQKSPKGSYFLVDDKNRASKKEESRPGAVAVVDPHLMIAGTEESVVAALARRAARTAVFTAGATGLGRELHRILRDSSAWVMIDTTSMAKIGHGKMPMQGGPDSSPVAGLFGAMRTVRVLIAQTRVDSNGLFFSLAGLTTDSETRKLMADTLNGLLAFWRLAVQDKQPEMIPVLRGFAVDTDDEGIRMAGTIPNEVLNKWIAEKPKETPTK